MPSYLSKIAEKLLDDHPGLPSLKVAIELTESFYRVMRKQLIKEGVLYIENLGKLEVKKYAGSEKKKDGKTGIYYSVPDRNVIKFKASQSLVSIVNMNRPKRQRVD